MVTYSYTVSQDGPLTDIQAAISLVSAELSTRPQITEDIVINVTDGSYSGFSIPNGALLPLLGTAYRLVIKSAGNYLPIVDFNLSSSTQIVGADIGSGNPNVTIDRIRFQYFAVGIRANINSHNIKVSRCLITNNRNVGVFIEQCANTQILQTVVVNGDYGIVCRMCKGLALVHNTVFLNGGIATTVGETKSAAWLSLANDYGAGLTDTGTLYLIGNILWSVAGPCLTVFHDDVERSGAIVSNYNDLVIGSRESFIVVEDRTFYSGNNSVPRTAYTRLRPWKVLGFDSNSRSEDPRFLSPIRTGAGRVRQAIDLSLLALSPVLGMVPSFYVDPTSTARWLPSYVDTADLESDMLGNSRQRSGTAAGANDRVSNLGFYGQDVFSSPVDLSITKNCDNIPLVDIFAKKLDLWYPQYNVGYFYGYEREYYLYARKGCSYLANLAATTFQLPSRIATNKPITLRVNNILTSGEGVLDVRGDSFTVFHEKAPIIYGDEEIQLQAYVPVWGSAGFSYTPTYFRFKANEGDLQFLLPSNYVPRGPVVVTDDAASNSDNDLISNREYSVSWNEDQQRAELVFVNNTNKVTNAQFDYTLSGTPDSWASSNAVVESAAYPNFNIAGSTVCHISPSGYIQQELPAITGSTCFSFHAYGISGASIGYRLQYFDYFNRDLGYVLQGTISPSTTWNRHYLGLGPQNKTEFSDTSSVPVVGLTGLDLPDGACKVIATISNASASGQLYIDAVQYEYRQTPSLYHRRPRLHELTVEYETSDKDVYIDTNQILAPAVNLMTDGFLYIPEILASDYGGPDSTTVTTLNEWRWPAGRMKLIPWSRTQGKDKLRKRAEGRFHSVPTAKPEIVTPANPASSVQSIEMIPSVPVVVAGDLNGIGITVVTYDEYNNPMAHKAYNAILFDPTVQFPGWLSQRLYGLKQQLGQSIYGYTSTAGSFTFTWIPPKDLTVYVDTPEPKYNGELGEATSYLQVKYPVNLAFNGNVIVLDRQGQRISTSSSDFIRGTYTPKYGTGFSMVKLDYPITPTSLTVKVGGTVLSETFTNSPDSDQFFVDYEGAVIYLKGKIPSVDIDYRPAYVYVSQKDPYKIVFYHDRVFGTYTDKITVGYDAVISLSVEVDGVTQVFELVARNKLSTAVVSSNYIANELV